ncbi:iron chaperone [Companilactobacillus metriopterae]|uniref:iron chaperone n=1 Tax=Companilactobacillus metriopterae TaxID=1909267 RepID=UPI00100AC670|nr:DUF1801 domain-containing protein [Companilactobacillus metriopterae]
MNAEILEYIDNIRNAENRKKFKSIIDWTMTNYPKLDMRMAWNQPTFTDHGTFIVSYKSTVDHISVTPEVYTIQKFTKEITDAGYKYGKMTYQIPYSENFDSKLLQTLIDFNISDKKDTTRFWRKNSDA